MTQRPELVRFQLFGDVAAYSGDRRVDMGTPKERCLLAALLFHNGQRIPRTDLTSWIWDSEPRKSLDELNRFMTNLRTRLSSIGLSGALQNKDGLCRLDVPAGSVDVHRFRAMVAEARGADDARAASLLTEALDLSRDEFLAGLHTMRAGGVRQTIATERRAAEVAFLRVELRLGHHEQRIADIARLFDERPNDETLAELAMDAHYHAGQQSTVTDVYLRHRDSLDKQGHSLSPQLQKLYLRMLNHEIPRRQPRSPQPDSPTVTQVPAAELAQAQHAPPPPPEAREALDTHHLVVLVGAQADCRAAALRLLGDPSHGAGRTVTEVLKNWTRPAVAALPVPPEKRGYLLTLNDSTTDVAGAAFAEDLLTHARRLGERRSCLVVTTTPELWRDCWQVANHVTVRVSRPAGTTAPEREQLLLTAPDGERSAFPLRDGHVPRRRITLGRSVDGDPDPDLVLDTGNDSPVSRRHAFLVHNDDGEWWLEPKGKNAPLIRRRGESHARRVDEPVRLYHLDVVLVAVLAEQDGGWRGWELEFFDPNSTITPRGDTCDNHID